MRRLSAAALIGVLVPTQPACQRPEAPSEEPKLAAAVEEHAAVPPQQIVFPVWPGEAPDGWSSVGPRDETSQPDTLIAGRPYKLLGNVAYPTLTVYPLQGASTGAAILVFPGGGYRYLATDLEGTEACDWVSSKGIACVLVRYRVPGKGLYPAPAPYPKSGPYPDSPIALEDAQRAISVVRAHAEEWHVDPGKIGVMGFSAGGHLVAATSTHFAHRIYAPVDDVDRVSCRPDFALAIYPGHLSIYAEPHRLNSDIRVTSQTPPTFLLHAEDDPIDRVEHSLSYYSALRAAKVPVEMHIFAEGGHAFGLRHTEKPITEWPSLAEKWLSTIGILPK